MLCLRCGRSPILISATVSGRFFATALCHLRSDCIGSPRIFLP
eukprot:XP_001705316.1 Hypothetical protein GL50803_35565 [Giardia lamblia ATCC 50803]